VQVKALRAQVEALVQTQEKLQQHTAALQQLKNTCAPAGREGTCASPSSRAPRAQVPTRRAAHRLPGQLRGRAGARALAARLTQRLAPKPRQAKLTLQGPLGSSAAFKRDMETRLQAFDRAVWVRLRDARLASATFDSLRAQGVNHSGPMPGEDDDGMWVEGTQDDLPPNVKCPLTGKALLDLQEPVRCDGRDV
jgi:hypothetical protein